jgi:hypothetical protein
MVVGVVGYTLTPRGLRSLNTVWAHHLSDEVKRRFYKNWRVAPPAPPPAPGAPLGPVLFFLPRAGALPWEGRAGGTARVRVRVGSAATRAHGERAPTGRAPAARRYKSKKKAFTKYVAKYSDGRKSIEDELNVLKKHCTVIRALVHTQIKKIGFGQQKAHLAEIQVMLMPPLRLCLLLPRRPAPRAPVLLCLSAWPARQRRGAARSRARRACADAAARAP